MDNNEMATQPETTGAETQETTSEKEKLFTQEEVNSFVQSRVQRLRSQISKESNAEYEQKMADLSKREMQLVAKEKLLDSGLPKDLAGLITGENEEEIDEKIKILKAYCSKGEENKDKDDHTPEVQGFRQIGAAPNSGKATGIDPVRKAMGLSRKE